MNVEWAKGWIIETLRQQGVNITTGIIVDVNRSLEEMVQDKTKLPTIETLISLMKNEEAKKALHEYQKVGPRGNLFAN